MFCASSHASMEIERQKEDNPGSPILTMFTNSFIGPVLKSANTVVREVMQATSQNVQTPATKLQLQDATTSMQTALLCLENADVQYPWTNICGFLEICVSSTMERRLSEGRNFVTILDILRLVSKRTLPSFAYTVVERAIETCLGLIMDSNSGSMLAVLSHSLRVGGSGHAPSDSPKAALASAACNQSRSLNCPTHISDLCQ